MSSAENFTQGAKRNNGLLDKLDFIDNDNIHRN